MAEILSQSDIDQLLNSISEGNADIINFKEQSTKNYKIYDFREPNRFAKEQMRTLKEIYDNFSRLLASHLSGILRTFCQVDVISVEEQTYYEFNNSLPSPIILAVLQLSPLKGSVLLEISPALAFNMIDRLLGGFGQSKVQERDFTEIELTLIEKLVRQFLDLLKDSWARVIEVVPVLERIETSSQFAQIVPYNEIIAIITLSVKIGDMEGVLNFCIPHLGVESIVKQLNLKLFFSPDEDKNSENLEKIRNRINEVTQDVIAVLGDTHVLASEILMLQEGDVIQIDKKTNDYLPIQIGESVKFLGEIGRVKDKIAVKIVSTVNTREETV